MQVEFEPQYHPQPENLKLLTQQILEPKQNYCDMADVLGNIQKLESLANRLLLKKDVSGSLSLLSMAPMLAGIITLINSWHFSEGLTVLLGGLSFALGIVGTVIITILLATTQGRDLFQFGWIDKMLSKLPGFKHRQKEYDDFRDKFYAALEKEEFKHDYLTHVQYKIMQYQQLLQMLSHEDEQYYFDDIENLKEAIVNLKRQQSIVIKIMLENNHVETIGNIVMLESMFVDIDDMVKQQSNHQQQQAFLEKHKELLEKRGLSQMMDETHAQWKNSLPAEQKLENYL